MIRFTNAAARLLLMLTWIVPVLACSLGSVPPATPTPQPAALTSPIVGLNPVVGAPGSDLSVTGLGFTPNSQVNLFLSVQNASGAAPVRTLPVDGSGAVKFGLKLPVQINGVAIGGGTTIGFTLAAANGGPSASAIFLVVGGTPVATPGTPTSGDIPATTGAATLFITAPTNPLLSGNSVGVAGSGPAGSQVSVQVQDANNTILGSAVSVVHASADGVGVWGAMLSFTTPTTANGFIVAFTGGQQASIPVTFGAVGAATTPVFFGGVTATP